MMGVETGKTEVKASEVAGVAEAEVVAEVEVTMMIGTEEMTSEIATDEALTMVLRVDGVVDEATVMMEVDMVGAVSMHAHLILLAAATANRQARMHALLILLAAATTNQQARQLLTLNPLPGPLVRRYVSVAHCKHAPVLDMK